MTNAKNVIREMLLAGKTPKDIRALHPEISGSAISNARRLLGIPKFPTGRKPGLVDLARAEKVRRMKSGGSTYREIGSKFGISRQRAHQLIQPKMNRAGTCERCGVSAKSLHAHHISYENDSCQLLCASCHATVGHAIKKMLRKYGGEGRSAS